MLGMNNCGRIFTPFGVTKEISTCNVGISFVLERQKFSYVSWRNKKIQLYVAARDFMLGMNFCGRIFTPFGISWFNNIKASFGLLFFEIY
jgi:hypothetical protein